jgi:uncharacterized small protein (DUF1192 family)
MDSSDASAGAEPDDEATTGEQTVAALAERVAALESEVERLREAVDERERTIRFLAADADIDPVESACPDCGHAPVRKESGVTWRRIVCDDCGKRWYL